MMVERRPVLDFVSHAVLILGVAVVAFPVFIAIVMSTQTADQIAGSNPLSLVPGGNIVESYRLALGVALVVALPSLGSSLRIQRWPVLATTMAKPPPPLRAQPCRALLPPPTCLNW